MSKALMHKTQINGSTFLCPVEVDAKHSEMLKGMMWWGQGAHKNFGKIEITNVACKELWFQ